jgi:hypothetical protein
MDLHLVGGYSGVGLNTDAIGSWCEYMGGVYLSVGERIKGVQVGFHLEGVNNTRFLAIHFARELHLIFFRNLSLLSSIASSLEYI